MVVYIALLRAVNVGGTGKLKMADLKELCEETGFLEVKTYIASGNVVFNSKLKANTVKQRLEKALAERFSKSIKVVVRTAAELRVVLTSNPYQSMPPSSTIITFLDSAPPERALDDAKNQADEEISLGIREIYVAYKQGMSNSKLKIPAAAEGTGRNLNTVTKLMEMADAAEL